MRVTLIKSRTFRKERRTHLVDDVLMWHLWELEHKYFMMVDGHDARVCRRVSGRYQQFTLSYWIWSILTVLHTKSVDGAAAVWRRMVGDFKKGSLNPTSMHRQPKPRGLVAAIALPVVNGEAAGPIVPPVAAG